MGTLLDHTWSGVLTDDGVPLNLFSPVESGLLQGSGGRGRKTQETRRYEGEQPTSTLHLSTPRTSQLLQCSWQPPMHLSPLLSLRADTHFLLVSSLMGPCRTHGNQEELHQYLVVQQIKGT